MTRHPHQPASTTPMALFLIIVLIFCLAGCGGGEDQTEDQAPAPMQIRAMKVEATNATLMHDFVATIQARETVEIRARVAGFLEKRHFQEGALVQQGDLLFTIDPQEYQQASDAARSQLQRDQAALNLAKKDLERFETLYQQGVVSREEYDSKLATYQQALATVQADQAQLNQSNINQGYTQVTAPITGRIGRAQVDEGSLVGQGENTLLAEMTSVDPIYANFNISEQDYLAHLRRRQEAQEAGAGNATATLELVLADDTVYPYNGSINMVDPTLDQTTGTLGIRAQFPNPDGTLLPGQYARVRILFDSPEPQILIPQSAVAEVQGVKQVFIVVNGQVAVRQVTLGADSGANVIVQQGLQNGDVLLVEGLQKLRQGMPVEPVFGDAQNATAPASATQPGAAATGAAQ